MGDPPDAIEQPLIQISVLRLHGFGLQICRWAQSSCAEERIRDSNCSEVRGGAIYRFYGHKWEGSCLSKRLPADLWFKRNLGAAQPLEETLGQVIGVCMNMRPSRTAMS